MLKIAIIGNSYSEVKLFVEYKFKNKIEKINEMKKVYTLTNGDELILCYGARVDNFKSYEFDAMIISPNYESLVDVIRRRCERQCH